MYIAMNRFKIVKGKESEFENVWKNRETHKVPGFKNFNLVKGDANEDHTLYAFKFSIWETNQDFWNWTKSEAFATHDLLHKDAGKYYYRDLYIGPPNFEG